jgi:Tol biopolymer transport system component
VVAVVCLGGTDQKDLSSNDPSNEARGPAWSPDGRFLLVQRGNDDRYDLWIMDLDGRFIGQVTHEPSNYGTYSWAPVSGS